ncbi:hypothetical protein GGP72_003321 [Salinibacter ruber]|uniref:Uncharacterized protein n=1 Tax=Salinibacter ruber TaxID=146919 RepID=A0A9X2TDD9_9BACT|nr:hypothetical protein [Salinibacter ruber]MCS3679365.1 hypothetical protein [Salinibacter ruber]MCS3682657.1 hypothetical protein [Salinibacter ruber]
MDIRDYITPLSVILFFGGALLLCVIAILLTPAYWDTILNRYMDLVVVASLLVTIAILSDLKELQKRYLLRATIDDLQDNLIQRAENMNEAFTSGIEGSRTQISKELSKEEGILKQIADRTEEIDSDVHEAAEDLRDDISTYRSSSQRDEAKLYDIWEETHAVNELLKGLIEESKWKR